ncbi:MAG: hypothetical protein KJP00_09760 [Bacteroidia bacterium]|nr:hypothetical protein [Bacteroidia bacterium]
MKTTQILTLIAFCIFFVVEASSQEVEYQAKEYIAEDGTIYWNKALPLYLRVSPYPDGQGHLVSSKNLSYTNPMYLDTEGVNYIRTRYAVNKETQKIITPKVEVLMPIVADGSGPNSVISFKNAQSSRSGGTQYYGPNLVVGITTSDKLSGVSLLKYKVDVTAFADYTSELNVNTEGPHSISFYGVDNVGNKETTQTSSFVVDLTPPEVTHNINGFADGNVIAAPSKIYFTSSDALSGVDRIMYRFDDEEYKRYNGSDVRFSYLSDGEHVLEYYAVDEVGNQTGIFVFDLYFDKTAPMTASDILGDRFVVNKKVYFSGRTKMKLTAVDNKIGVKEIRYSIDGSAFEVYDQPFYLPSVPGEHTIRYYSQDRLENRPSGSESYKHNINLVFLDLSGPSISHRINGDGFRAGGFQYISPRTEIQLVGRDPESGLQYMTYSIDGDAAEQVYSEPFTINTTGEHKIELFAYDNVNNRNVGSTTVYVDATPPNIFQNFSTRSVGNEDGLDVYPPYVTVFLAATDDIVGNDRIYYSINGGSERLFTKPISALKRNTVYNFSVRAIDMVGNESTAQFKFKTANN